MRRILCIVLILMTFLVSQAQQTLVMPTREVIDTVLCDGMPITVVNPPLQYRNLGIRCTGGVLLDAFQVMPIDIIIDADLCDPSTQLIIFNGNDVYSPILGVLGAMENTHHRRYRASSGHAFIQYVTTGSNTCQETFSVKLSTGISQEVDPINHNNATIRWSDPDHSEWNIYWGSRQNLNGTPILDHSTTTTDTFYHITGLDEGTQYYYQVLPSGNQPIIYNEACPNPSFHTRCGFRENYSNTYVDSIQIDWYDFDHPTGTPWTIIYSTEESPNYNDLTTWNRIQSYTHPITIPDIPNYTSITYKVYSGDSIYPINNRQCRFRQAQTNVESANFIIQGDSIYLSDYNARNELINRINYNQTNTPRTIRIYELDRPFGVAIDTFYIHLNPHDSVFYFPTYEGACYSYMILHSDTFYIGKNRPNTNYFQVPCGNRTLHATYAGNNITLEWENSADTNMALFYGKSITALTNEIRACASPITINNYSHRTFYYKLISGNQTHTPGNTQCVMGPLILDIDNTTNTGCINFTDFYGDAIFYAGFAGKELEVVNPIEYGEFNYSDSRHTVHTGARLDPNVPISTIPPDEIVSVRLGSTTTGLAQKIRYPYHVDTRQTELLILKYAIVLQSPWGHPDEMMPKFTFSFTDAAGNTINPDCTHGDFYPGSASATQWNENSNRTLVWQDWTTLGINLTPYEGQTIYIDLYSQGCSAMGHYGYAYFHLSCAQKTIQSKSCGDNISNVFRAPQGFDYQWYNENDPSTILSTDDSIAVTEPGTYKCLMSFHSQNPNALCQFTSTAIAMSRYPWARFSSSIIDTTNCHYHYHFENNSIITTDEAHTNPTDLPCESYEWIVNDSIRFYTKDLDNYLYFGRHKIQLVAKLSTGQCSDTATTYLDLSPACLNVINQHQDICQDSSIVFYDTILRSTGTYSHQYGSFITSLDLQVHPTPQHDTSISVCDSIIWESQHYRESGHYEMHYRTIHDCDSLQRLNLTIRHSTTGNIKDTCVENDLPRDAAGVLFNNDHPDTTLQTTNAAGCDSTMTYSLHVWSNVASFFDTSVCPESLPMEWRNVWFNDDGTQTQYLPRGASHGEDGTATLSMSLYTNYIDSIYDTVLEINLPHYYMERGYTQGATFDSFYAQTIHGCDSILYYSLFVHLSAISCDRYLQFPNIVTPNNDGHNDRFAIVNLLELKCYEHTQLIIYNRWGTPVYNVRDIRRKEDFWNPAETHSPAGTYYYRFDAHGTRGNVERHGTIEVIY